MFRTPDADPSRRRLHARSIVLVLAALVTLGAWGFASPPGSSPDEVFHLDSIWCARGLSDQCAGVPKDAGVRMLPDEVALADCYQHDPNKSARCLDRRDGVMSPEIVTGYGNWSGLYPPVFYLVMSPLVTSHFTLSVVLMRALNALIAVAAVAALAFLLPRRHRALATVPLLATCVPLAVFLVPSTNPTSWAIVSAATLWPSLYAAFDVEGRRRVALLCFAVVMAVVGAGARADSALFTVMAAGLVLLMRLPRLRSGKVAVLGCLAVAVVGAALFLSAGNAASVTHGFGAPPTTTSTGPSWLGLAVGNFQALPVLLFGGLGFGFMGSLGALDTPVPAVVEFLPTAVWAGLVFVGWRAQAWTKVLGIVLTGAAMVVYPLVTLGLSGLTVGNSFQPRYVLPVLVIFTGVSLLGFRRETWGLSRLQVVMAAGSLSLANLVALDTTIRRYVTGLDKSGLDLDHHRQWWWAGLPLSADAVLVVGSAAFAVVAYLVLSQLAAPTSRAADAARAATPADVEETVPA